MKKRYRRPKVVESEIKFQKGKFDDEVDMCIFYGDNVPRCDRALVLTMFCSERQRIDLSTCRPKLSPSFIDELELRGYDMDTLRFSIKKKVGEE